MKGRLGDGEQHSKIGKGLERRGIREEGERAEARSKPL